MKSLKRITIALFAMLLGMASANAQECRLETIKEFLSTNTQIQASIVNLKSGLNTINEMLYSHVDEVTLNRLSNRYLRDQYMEDVASVLQEFFEGNVTEIQLKEVISLLSTLDGKDYIFDVAQWNNEQTYTITEIIKSAAELSQIGIRDDPVYVDEDISPSYVDKFLEYAEASDLEEQFMTTFRRGLGGVDMPYVFWDWMNENLLTVLLNSAHGNITVADMDYGIKLFNNQSYRNVYASTASMLSDYGELGISILSRYKAWMSDQGVDAYEYDYDYGY